MAVPTELGLQLLLYPLNSNIVVRTACCSVGIALPVYSTFKAIEKKDLNEQQRWLVYWAAFGSFSLAEVFIDKILSWFPLYYHVKLAFLVWLQLPSANGARHLYMSHLRPFLLKRQARLDQIVEFICREMSRLVNAYGAQLQFAKTILRKAFEFASGMVRDVVRPEPRQGSSAIRGPTRQIQDSESDKED